MFEFLKDKKFITWAMSLAIPVAVQNLIDAGINLVDTLMVATLDAASVAAVGSANNIFNLWFTISFGIISGANILCSQFAGANRFDLLRRTFGLTVCCTLVFSQIFFIPAVFFTNDVMSLLVVEKNVVDVGVRYLPIVAWTYPLIGIINTIICMLRSTGRIRVTMFSSFMALIVNVAFNWTLINGNFGAPALGVVGAAIATVGSRIVELIVLVAYLFIAKSRLVRVLSDMVSFFNIEYLKLYFSNVWVTTVDEIIYGLGIAMYFVIYGRLPANQLSAISIIYVLHDILLTFVFGFGSACSVILGIELGRDNIVVAKKYAKYFVWLFIWLTLIVDVLTFAAKGPFLSLYQNLGVDVVYYIDKCMWGLLIIFSLGSFSYLFMLGILRSGGDVKSSILIDLISNWLVGIPVAILTIIVLKMPIHYAYAILSIEEIIKSVLSLIRYKQDKWANNIVKNVE